MTYNIQNVDALETSAIELSNQNQKISDCATSLVYIIDLIKNNWQNEAGADLQSILTELTDCANTITNGINPTVGKYVTTMNTLVAETRSHQSKTME